MENLTSLEHSLRSIDDSGRRESLGSRVLQSKDSLQQIREIRSTNDEQGCHLPGLELVETPVTNDYARLEAAGALVGGIGLGAASGAGAYVLQSLGNAVMPRVFTAGAGRAAASMALMGFARGGIYGAAAVGIGILGYEAVQQFRSHPEGTP